MGTQSEQLERKAHQVRARLTETLEELRAGMTPGQVVDRLSVRKAIERIRFTKKKSPALPNGALRLGEPPGSGCASLIVIVHFWSRRRPPSTSPWCPQHPRTGNRRRD